LARHLKTTIMERRRSENRRPQSKGNSMNANIEHGFSQEARVIQVDQHAKRLQKFSCLDAETARRIAEKQAGERERPKHGRRVPASNSAAMRASHGSLWERNGIRPPNSDNVEVDKGRTRTIHQKFSEEERKLIRNRGKRRHRVGTAPIASTSPVQGSGVEDAALEEVEGKHPVKPHLAILSLVDMEADEAPESEAGTERSALSQASSSSPRNRHIAQKTVSREEERKLIEHAFLKAREHKAAARVALNKVPAEALSGESHFDLAAFMRSTADR